MQTYTHARTHSLHSTYTGMLCIVQLDTFFPNAGSADVERKWRGFHSHNGKQTQLLLIKHMWPRAIHTPLRLAFRHIIGSSSV